MAAITHLNNQRKSFACTCDVIVSCLFFMHVCLFVHICVCMYITCFSHIAFSRWGFRSRCQRGGSGVGGGLLGSGGSALVAVVMAAARADADSLLVPYSGLRPLRDARISFNQYAAHSQAGVSSRGLSVGGGRRHQCRHLAGRKWRQRRRWLGRCTTLG